MTETEFLYHGSPKKMEVLDPGVCMQNGLFRSRCNFKLLDNQKEAIYATPIKELAICFAMDCVSDDNEIVERRIIKSDHEKIIYKNGHPNFGGVGYLYKLDKSAFTFAFDNQWVCYDTIVPLQVEEIKVNDYLDLIEIE